MTDGAAFWNRIADRYAARAIRDVPAYEAMLADAASRLRPGNRVLEIGCGTGGTAIRLAEGVADYLATDFSDRMIAIARAKPAPGTVRFLVANAEAAPPGGPFDAICAFNVLHLVDDLPALLRGLHGSLRPGGLLICKVWCFAELPLHLRVLFHLLRLAGLFPRARFLTRGQVRTMLADAGFDIAAERVFGAHPQNPYLVAWRRDPGDGTPPGAREAVAPEGHRP
jgi:SAM-dependent methyltransferase